MFERVAKDDDVAAAHIAVRQHVAPDMPAGRVDQFVHQDVVADQQGAHHGGAGNDEGLDQRGGAEQQQDDGYGPFGDESALHVVGQLGDARPDARRL